MHNSKQNHQEEKQLSPVWLQVVHPGSTNSQCQGELILQCHCLHYKAAEEAKGLQWIPCSEQCSPHGHPEPGSSITPESSAGNDRHCSPLQALPSQAAFQQYSTAQAQAGTSFPRGCGQGWQSCADPTALPGLLSSLWAGLR